MIIRNGNANFISKHTVGGDADESAGVAGFLVGRLLQMEAQVEEQMEAQVEGQV